MLMTFLSSVFITLFLLLGAWSFFGFLELMRAKYPLSWLCYQHVIVLAALAVLFLIASIVVGLQIPDCYAS